MKAATSRDNRLSGISMGTFRKNLSAVMELAGADHERIGAHQGRYKGGVIKKNYLRDPMRAANPMRPFIHRVFDGDEKRRLEVLSS